ncbi:hypothetical protein GOODEAATRI_005856 [Goodea atripinnis]|uniref:Uncharacterized protein n=1 Tax=Goodea atripinnis TaxID=208336 RepID=A0ABV0PLE2_9TELE
MKPCGGEDNSSSGSRLRKDECGPDELILLLIYLYSLAEEAQNTDSEEEELGKLERELIGALTLVITRETELSPLLQNLIGEQALLLSFLVPHVLGQKHTHFYKPRKKSVTR